MTSSRKRPTPAKDRVPQHVKLGYGTGHVLNDMCASMWFTYLLLFFHRVLGFSNGLAGVIMVVGQVGDGLSTVFVGYFQDWGTDWWLCRLYSKRKGWHLVGTICVVVSFPFVFSSCVGCQNAPDVYQIVYYSVFVLVFQFGWACTQISHLALIPDLTACKIERTSLTSYRYAATVLANLGVYLSMWAFLGPLSSGNETSIGPNDATIFRNVAFISIGVGSVMSLIFHVLVRVDGSWHKGSSNNLIEPMITSSENYITDDNLETATETPTDAESARKYSLPNSANQLQGATDKGSPMTISDWLREPQFYQVCVLYLSTRLFVNLSQSYITLYLDVTLGLKPINVAIIPLIMYLASLLTSPIMKSFTRLVGRKGAFVVACMVGLGGCVWVWFGIYTSKTYTTKEIYIVAMLYGAGGSALLITSISATADLIADDVESGAFVYGVTSLFDKFSNALAFGVIQELVPTNEEDAKDFYKYILVFVCGGAAILPILTLFTMCRTKIGKRDRDKRHEQKMKSINSGRP